MKISHVLKAALIVICCVIGFTIGVFIIPFGLGLLAIWIVALMMSETEEQSK